MKSGCLRDAIEHQHLLSHDFCSDPVLSLFVLILAVNQPPFYGHLAAFRQVFTHDFGELSPGNHIVPLGRFRLFALGVAVHFIRGQPQSGFDLVPVEFGPFGVLTEASNQQDAVAQCIHFFVGLKGIFGQSAADFSCSAPPMRLHLQKVTKALFAYVLGMDSTLFSGKYLMAAVIALATTTSSFSQHNAVWVDAVPVTRHLFGAAPDTDVNLAAGWNSNIQGNGWRTLVGFAVSSETTDSFGTQVKTNSQNLSLRAGYRWFSSSKDGTQARCRPVWGIDALSRRDHLITRSSNVDFTSDFSTTVSDWGLSGVLGADLMLAPKLHLIIETRLDGFYRTEKTVQSDSFGGDFEQSDWGWEAQLNAPLSLYVALGL